MKILVVSDDGVSTGYGRISMETNSRLVQRGYEVMALSLYYDALLPASNDSKALPYWVGSLAGKPNWIESVIAVVNAFQPDIIHVTQDAPYAEQLRNAPLDWSRYALVVTTPVDGAPVRRQWMDTLKQGDGTLSISQFGVDTHRAAGVPSELCRPGVDGNTFFQMSEIDRHNMRLKVGIAPDAFVVGTMCMNQGRKDIPDMLRAFFAFAADKPTARYLLDMDATSPAGWDIIQDICAPNGWDVSKLLFRADAMRAGIVTLRARYNLLDAHMVISHREGYGLPLAEAMACGVVSIALDWCSGTEICGDGHGILINPIEYEGISTWGGAFDKFPKVHEITRALQMLYNEPDTRRSIARKGMEWSRAQTWDAATDAVAKVYERVMAKRQQQPVSAPVMIAPPAPVPSGLADGTPVLSIQGQPVVAQADGMMPEVVPLVESVG
jgi:glycosyltransferase involved in cell wall biosynthesis